MEFRKSMVWTPQGLIAPAILVDEKQIASPHPVDGCDAVDDFVHWAQERAMLVPGEFPEEALLFDDFSYYYGNVVNGGHAQFVYNSEARFGELDATMLARVERLLDAVGAREHRGIFRDFVAFIIAMPETDRRELSNDDLEEFNRRFFGATEDEDALWERVRHWLAGLPVLRKLPAAALEAEREAILAANPLRQARRDAEQARRNAEKAERAEAEAKDPLHVAAKTLCTEAGLEFKGFTGRDPRWMPEVFIWTFRTSDGHRDIVLKNGRAYLMQKGDWKANGDWTGLSCECAVDPAQWL